MAISDTRKESSKEGKKFTTAKYYIRPNGSAVINIPKGFDGGLEHGEELIVKREGSRIILMPLKSLDF